MKSVVTTLIVLVLLLATSCVQPAEITPSAEREVFVKCILMNDTVQTVTLLYSGAIDANRFEPVEEAEVYIDSPDHVKIRFVPKGDGVWENGFQPQAGDTYTLNVKIPGRETITATTRFPDKFTIIPKRSMPARWVKDMRSVYEGIAPGSAGNEMLYRSLSPQWIGTLRRYIPHTGGTSVVLGAIEDLDVLDRIAEYGGTTMQQAMPGMAFRLESESEVCLYILGTTTDEQGFVSRMRRLGTNHRNIDRSNLLTEAFFSGIGPDEVSAPYIVDISYGNHQYDNPQNRQTYNKAILSSYDGQPVYSDYLRIVTGSEYDNGLKLYSIINEENYFILEKSSTIVKPPYSPPAEEYGQPYYLCFIEYGQRYFSVYGDYYYNIWGENETETHPSLYFCSVSPEYDQYLQSVRSFLNQQQGDLLTVVYSDIRNETSNINGGYGVFGAVSVLRHDCDAQYAPRYLHPESPDSIYDWYNDYPAFPAPLPSL